MTPEIVDDELAELLTRLASEPNVNTVLEVGAGDGRGSTAALIAGLKGKTDWRMACLETRADRFDQLRAAVSPWKTVHCYHASSTPISCWMTADQVREFYQMNMTMLNRHPIEHVLGWLEEERNHVIVQNLCQNGILQIKQEFGCSNFDLVLLDGCPFCGVPDAAAVADSRIIVLDDVNDIKNYRVFTRLSADPGYHLEWWSTTLRNGYAVFRKC